MYVHIISEPSIHKLNHIFILYLLVGGEALENIDTSTTSIKNSQVRFNDNSKWHKVSVIKSGFETILVVDNYRSSTHNRRDITFEGSQNDSNGKTWTKRKLNVPENIGVDKVRYLKIAVRNFDMGI